MGIEIDSLLSRWFSDFGSGDARWCWSLFYQIEPCYPGARKLILRVHEKVTVPQSALVRHEESEGESNLT